MRPTVDEQLAGALRLLTSARADSSLAEETAELLANAQRLVHRVAGSWDTALGFLLEDNAALQRFIDGAGPTEIDAVPTVATAAERNALLRQSLAESIRTLPADDNRRARLVDIGKYLQQRVDSDPT
jgi:hypothetical protein